MPTTFQGGYVGGMTPQRPDFTALQNAVIARNQRLDAPQADRLAKYELPGLAYFAANGDENAKRFLDRYYGRDQWQSYIPDVNVQDYTTTPATGTPWGVNARINFERDTFGFAPLAGEGAPPAGKEAGQQKSSEQVNPEQQTNPEVVQTESTPPIIESQTQITTPPVTDNTVVTDTATETPRQQWQRPWKQQEIVESTPPAQQATPQPSRQVLGYDRDKSVNANAPVEWQPPANVMQAMEGVLDAMAQAVQRGATPEQAYEGMQRSHDPNLLKLRQAVAGVVGPDGKPLSEQAALDWYQRTYRQGTSGVTDPMNQLDLVARMNQQRQAMAAAQARQRAQAQQEAVPFYQRPQQTGDYQPGGGSDRGFGSPQSAAPQQPYNPRVGVPTEGAGYQSAMQPMEPTASTQTEPPAQPTLVDIISQTRDNAQARAAAIANTTESSLADEQVQIINEATGRGGETTPTLYLGKRAEGIPLHSAAERQVGQQIKRLVTSDPESQSGKAAAAAIRNVFKRDAPALRTAIRENVQQNGTLVPQGAFARQVYDAVRADPQGSAIFFNDLATNYLTAGATQAQTEYQQALAREATARAQGQEQSNAATEALGTEFITEVQREQLKQLQLANQMAQVQLDFAPQQLSANIMESLTAIGVNRVQAQAIADNIGLGWAQLEMEAQLRQMEAEGKLQEALSKENYERVKVTLDALDKLDEDTPPEIRQRLINEITAALAGTTFSGKLRTFKPMTWVFGDWKNLQVESVPGFQSYANPTGAPPPTNTPPTPEENNVGSDYNLQ